MFNWFLSFPKRRELALGAFSKAKKDLQKLIDDIYVFNDKVHDRKDLRIQAIVKLEEANEKDDALQRNVVEQANDAIATIQKIDAFLS